MTSAYRIAEASLITTLKYLSIISAVVGGYYIFNEIPSIITLIGTMLIVLSSFIIFMREKIKNKKIIPLRQN